MAQDRRDSRHDHDDREIVEQVNIVHRANCNRDRKSPHLKSAALNDRLRLGRSVPPEVPHEINLHQAQASADRNVQSQCDLISAPLGHVTAG